MRQDATLMTMLRVLGTMDVGDATAHHVDLHMAWRDWCKSACPMPEPRAGLLHPLAAEVLEFCGQQHGGLDAAEAAWSWWPDLGQAVRSWLDAGAPLFADTPAPTTDADCLQVVIDAGLDARPDLAPAVGRALLAERETLAQARARVTELESLLFGPDNESGLFYAAAAVSHGARREPPNPSGLKGRLWGRYVTEGEWNWLETCVRNVLREGSSA